MHVLSHVYANTHVQCSLMGCLLGYACLGLFVSCGRRGYVRRMFTHVYTGNETLFVFIVFALVISYYVCKYISL